MRTQTFKCPVCGGIVEAEPHFYGDDELVLRFKCRRCGRWLDADATDALDDAREYFDDEMRRVENDGD